MLVADPREAFSRSAVKQLMPPIRDQAIDPEKFKQPVPTSNTVNSPEDGPSKPPPAPGALKIFLANLNLVLGKGRNGTAHRGVGF